MDLLKRPAVSYASLSELSGSANPVADAAIGAQVEIQAKYQGYVARQREEIERHERYEAMTLPGDLDYGEVRGLSIEVRQKLSQHRPETIGQASRVSGITPAAISLLWFISNVVQAAGKIRCMTAIVAGGEQGGPTKQRNGIAEVGLLDARAAAAHPAP
jgi:tRNA U34 5-carboxymethylaminomethyl modifying enzyme MnmG/GidA